MIGKKLSPVLVEIERALWEFEANRELKPEYTTEGFRAATKIFMSAMMDKLWELQQKEKMAMPDKCNMAEQCGNDLRKLVKTYTDIDTVELYKNGI